MRGDRPRPARRASRSSDAACAPRSWPYCGCGRSCRRCAATRDGLAVAQVRYRVRGWNGAERSPVADTSWALDELATRFPDVPVALVGHSMGGRAAIYAAGARRVRAVVGLAPWIEPGDPVAPLTGRRRAHRARRPRPDDRSACLGRVRPVRRAGSPNRSPTSASKASGTQCCDARHSGTTSHRIRCRDVSWAALRTDPRRATPRSIGRSACRAARARRVMGDRCGWARMEGS